MAIEIEKLAECELLALNNRIVERLRLLRQIRAHSTMIEFGIGERVSFQPDGRGAVFGVLVRYNKKTITVITDTGDHWNVAPSLLRKSVFESAAAVSSNVVQLRIDKP